jgi:hypothetical protein
MAVATQELARVLRPEPLPCCEIARRLGRRKADVLAGLAAEPATFRRTGRGRASRWSLRPARADLPVRELYRREAAVLELIKAGGLEPIDGLTMIVWPEHHVLLNEVAA